MPQVIRVGKFSIVVFTHDHAPGHVHVRFAGNEVRIAITAEAATFHSVAAGKPSAKDEKAALAVVAANLEACLAKWKEIHG